MNTETPDSWKFVKITNVETGETHDRVLCSWYGGFAGSDSWKLSSGNEEIIDRGNHLEVPQYSGTVYILYKAAERMSGLMACNLNHWQRDMTKIKMEVWDYVCQ